MRVATVAALIGGVGWVGKILIMLLQGGPDTDSIPEAIAFFAGLLGVVVAAGALPLVIVGAVQTAGKEAMPDAGWFRDEAVFLVLGAVALAFGAWSALQGGLTARR